MGLFGQLPVAVSIAAQIACVERELGQRRHVYERLVRDGKMTPEKAEEEITVMTAVRDTLMRLRDQGVSQ